MEVRARIPGWLGFAWWWLLIALMLVIGLRALHDKLLDQVLSSSFVLWLPVQALWLRRTSPNSVAVFFLAAGAAGNIVNSFATYLEERDAHYAAIMPLDWLTSSLELGGFAGLFVFAYELKRYLGRTDGYEPPVSYVWAFLLNIYYFQCKLHELYEDQRYRESVASARLA